MMASTARFTSLALLVAWSTGCGPARVGAPLADVAAATALRESLSSGSSGAAALEAAPVGTGWATLKGRFCLLDPLASGRLSSSTRKPRSARPEA